MSDFEHWLSLPIHPLDKVSREAAIQRQQQLTKPAGALGQLEDVAIQLAAMQGSETPNIGPVHITIYAGDHGIVEEAISAFPQSVTAAMLQNFATGGAAINVLARQLNASLDVINLGTVTPLAPIDGVSDQRIAAGTANFRHSPAMTQQQTQHAMLIGYHNVKRCLDKRISLYIGGEMGIGNTTASTALAACLLDCLPAEVIGAGSGLDSDGISHKLHVIEAALAQHRHHIDSAFSALQFFGGFEIAALTGSYLSCAKLGLPVLIDGFISSVAALTAEYIQPGCKQWFL